MAFALLGFFLGGGEEEEQESTAIHKVQAHYRVHDVIRQMAVLKIRVTLRVYQAVITPDIIALYSNKELIYSFFCIG